MCPYNEIGHLNNQFWAYPLYILFLTAYLARILVMFRIVKIIFDKSDLISLNKIRVAITHGFVGSFSIFCISAFLFSG